MELASPAAQGRHEKQGHHASAQESPHFYTPMLL